jgi:hypothetical protein
VDEGQGASAQSGCGVPRLGEKVHQRQGTVGRTKS